MSKENYNPNSAQHNDDWHNEYDGGREEREDHMLRNKDVPRHRDHWSYGNFDTPRPFNKSGEFWHKLEEIPEDANVPPEMLREAFNGLVAQVNKLIDWHNSIEEYEYNKTLKKK